ncbi:hypothetical protein BP5796_02566 [Coleophoma crateriformis]|uniref:Uncharacterized protein n=1 Tax=Coleophoma crateriformis TaxID=565419 RepID=A0A3D8SZ07_9HELO|nr:hypothetical protein BP5796_02566 [Coleophoma crateriformis]
MTLEGRHLAGSKPLQLPSIDEGFGSMASQYESTSTTSVKCETCAARGHTVYTIQGSPCPRCAINKLTPDPEQPNLNHESLSIRTRGMFSPYYEEVDPLSRRLSQGHGVSRPYHDSYPWVSSTSSSPLTATASVSSLSSVAPSQPSNPYHRHSIATQPFIFASEAEGHGNRKPYRSEKDIRHCDAEKARRDHQATYIDMGHSLRCEFPLDEEDASGDEAELTSELDQGHPNKRKTKEKTTKQHKLHNQVLWEFRACLRIDTNKVRKWLDRVKSQGEELKRRKYELKEGQGRGGLREGERERDRDRCVKAEAVMAMWDLMDREYWKFVAKHEESQDAQGQELEPIPGNRKRCLERL